MNEEDTKGYIYIYPYHGIINVYCSNVPTQPKHTEHMYGLLVGTEEDIDHGNDEDETVEGGVTVDLVPVVEPQPRPVQQRPDQLHHGVVVRPEDQAGQAGEADDQDSGDESEGLGERGGELGQASCEGDQDGDRTQGDSHRSQEVLQSGRSPANTRHGVTKSSL